MVVIRCHAIPHVLEAIVDAAKDFEKRLAKAHATYKDVLASKARLVPTERRVEQEITL